MVIVPATYSAEAVRGLYEIIDRLNLDGIRCHVIFDSQALRAAVIEANAIEEHGEMRFPVLAVLEMERVTRINTLLRIHSFWSDSDLHHPGVKPGTLAQKLYNTLTKKKNFTLVGL